VEPTEAQLDLIKQFQLTDRFFSSNALRNFARGGRTPDLPRGVTASERRGRRFFEDVPPGDTGKEGICASCHSGPLLNQTNEFLPLAVPPGTRFQSILVSELNVAGNPWITFVFRNQEHDLGENNQDGVRDGIIEVTSPDPGRALITGRADDFFPFPPGAFDHLNAFKISPLRGIAKTAPYFHDNSAKTLEAVAAHYREFFLIVTAGTLFLDDQDLADMVAFMKLL
jgi:cytochrome c peroxidase